MCKANRECWEEDWGGETGKTQALPVVPIAYASLTSVLVPLEECCGKLVAIEAQNKQAVPSWGINFI
jgi:hypothetical protein